MVLNKKKNYNKLFIVCVYALFWSFILLIGGMLLLFSEKVPMQLLVTICSWTPTMVLLIMFQKLLPDTSRRDFFNKLFREKINWRMLFTVTVIQFLIVLVSIYIVSFQNRVSVLSLLNLSLPVLLYAFFVSLITGATGEEFAWRGYLFPVMAKKSGVIKGSILLGLIWAFWHAPLWFATSGFSGSDLIIYIATFMIMIISVSVIIGICYNHNRNLVIPIWIHLLVNFSASLYAGNIENALDVTIYLALLYVLTAFGFCLWHKKTHKVSINMEFQKE